MSEFRELTVQDLDAYYEVVHEGYQADKAYPITFDAITAPKEKARRWLEENPTYGLFENDRLVSVLSLRMPWGSHPGPYGVPHLGWVATHPDFKHHGEFKKLFHEVETEILQKELRTPLVTLGTAESHPWLKEMYESVGFVPHETKQLPGKKHKTVYLWKKYDI